MTKNIVIEMVEKVQEGNIKAHRELVLFYSKKIREVGTNFFLKNPTLPLTIDDYIQEIHLTFLKRTPLFDKTKNTNFMSYIFTYVNFDLNNYIKKWEYNSKKTLNTSLELNEQDVIWKNNDPIKYLSELIESVNLKKLTKKDRNFFVTYVRTNFDIKETTSLLKISYGTSRKKTQILCKTRA